MIRPIPKQKPFRSAKYRHWVADHCCCVCGSLPSVAHHVNAGGMGTKCDDSKCAPLCDPFGHHSELHQMGKKSFEKKYAINLIAIANSLFSAYNTVSK